MKVDAVLGKRAGRRVFIRAQKGNSVFDGVLAPSVVFEPVFLDLVIEIR